MPEIRHIIVLRLGETSYTTIKRVLFRHLLLPEHHHIQKLLSTEHLGALCPTMFLGHLQLLLVGTADFVHMALLRESFLQRLRAKKRSTSVSAHKSSLSQLAELAHEMTDVPPAAINTAGVSPVSAVDSLQEAENLASEVAELRQELRDTRTSNHRFCPPHHSVTQPSVRRSFPQASCSFFTEEHALLPPPL
ncbi:hypothetical protein HPB49_012424 [Dermacentor silvarum]|uniref:Uncharacterized protein n=1 Tax=Dermacentor silvarum TaxID=543639 RepID=A0ACB8CF64_DERSI|nr:hypothetical protein HPB49_012424 [Dermacentor silvarum]